MSPDLMKTTAPESVAKIRHSAARCKLVTCEKSVSLSAESMSN